MELVRTRDTGLVEYIAIKIADNLIRAGRIIHDQWAVVPAAAVPEMTARELRWRASLQSFTLWASKLDFSQRRVQASGLCSRKTFETYMKILKDAGVVVAYPKSGTVWAFGWDVRKFNALLRRGLVTPPYPVEGEPPPLFATRGAESQLAQIRQLSQVSTWAREVGKR